MVPMTSSATINGQTRADCNWMSARRGTRRLELHARQAVDQRPAMAHHPATQSVALCNRRILQQIGMQAGGESAAQIPFSAPHEQRTCRERHERAELRADERHRFRKAHASAHRLRDFIQRVGLAVCRRDLCKCIGTDPLPIDRSHGDRPSESVE